MEDSGSNILFILADDMRASDLDHMARTQSLLVDQGMKFTRAWVTRSLCCPSRATILRGQYAHNHKVWVNVEPSGGFWKFFDQGLEDSTVATWLKAAGYGTILLGKYLNRYGLDRNGNRAPTTHVPPGWDRWYAWQGIYGGTDNAYKINENGRIVTYDRSEIHDTDLHAQTAENYIRNTAGSRPFFMYLAPNGPHDPAYYAPRHASMFSNTPLPGPSSFNEADVSDKPEWVRNKRRFSSTQISNMTRFYRSRLRALQSLDEMVERLVNALSATRRLSNTYIVLTSDNNGIYLGEHRLTAKGAAYNASPRVPLLIRSGRAPGSHPLPDSAQQRPGSHLRLLGWRQAASLRGRALARAAVEVEPAILVEDSLSRRAQAYAGGVRLRAGHTQLLGAEDGPVQLRRVRNQRAGALRPQRRPNRADQYPRKRLPDAPLRPQIKAGRAERLQGRRLQYRGERRLAATRTFRVSTSASQLRRFSKRSIPVQSLEALPPRQKAEMPTSGAIEEGVAG